MANRTGPKATPRKAKSWVAAQRLLVPLQLKIALELRQILRQMIARLDLLPREERISCDLS